MNDYKRLILFIKPYWKRLGLEKAGTGYRLYSAVGGRQSLCAVDYKGHGG